MSPQIFSTVSLQTRATLTGPGRHAGKILICVNPDHYKLHFIFAMILTGLQFRLTHDKEFDEIEYSPNPKSPDSEDVLMSLPNYLQENIFFGADQAPRFLAKLLKTAE